MPYRVAGWSGSRGDAFAHAVQHAGVGEPLDDLVVALTVAPQWDRASLLRCAVLGESGEGVSGVPGDAAVLIAQEEGAGSGFDVGAGQGAVVRGGRGELRTHLLMIAGTDPKSG